jgi:hypothetical protein
MEYCGDLTSKMSNAVNTLPQLGFWPTAFPKQLIEKICSSDSTSASNSESDSALGMRPALTVWPPAHLAVAAAILLEQDVVIALTSSLSR